MKLNKKLLPLVGVAATVATTIPLAMTLTSCNNAQYTEEIINIEDYDTTKIQPLTKEFASEDELIETYFKSKDALKLVADDTFKHVLSTQKEFNEKIKKGKTDSEVGKELYKQCVELSTKLGITPAIQIGNTAGSTSLQIDALSIKNIDKKAGTGVTYSVRVSGTFIMNVSIEQVDRKDDGTVATDPLDHILMSFKYILTDVPYGIQGNVAGQDHYLYFNPTDLKQDSEFTIERTIDYGFETSGGADRN